MKHIYYLLAFVLGLVLVSCGSNDDEILSPEVTRLAEEGFLPEMEVPTKLYYNESCSYVIYKADQRESFFKKLHDSETLIYIQYPSQECDIITYPFYDRVRRVFVAMNYKELEEMDEVLYAAPFLSRDQGPECYDGFELWGLPDLRSYLNFQLSSSEQKKVVEQFAEENGLVCGEKPTPAGTETTLSFSKNSKLFITDAVALLREKGIPAVIPTIIYSHEGWDWYIP